MNPTLSNHPSQANRVRLEGARKQALETGRNRLLVTAVVFALAFMVIGVRLVDLGYVDQGTEPRLAGTAASTEISHVRADIVDRNGVLLATSLPTVSLYADPQYISDADEAAAKLVSVLPDLDLDEVRAKLQTNGRFAWISRNLTPDQQYNVNRLGIPGLAFQNGERRVYPHGREAAHVLGFTDVDGRGIAGVERYFHTLLNKGGKPLTLSVDIRVQTILHDELSRSLETFKAIGAAGVVLDVRNGETIAMVSLPDFDPNLPTTAKGGNGFNRVTKSVYEMGSTFKLFTAAMALDTGTVTLKDGYDASEPIHISRFTIADYHAKNRWLSVPEILVYSSNIGAAKMAMDVGTRGQQTYLGRLGLLKSAAVELPEVGLPLTPARWRDINTMTISYGHGIAVSPLQVAGGVAALVNGGVNYPMTLIKHPDGFQVEGQRALTADTSVKMRKLMRLVVSKGTGRNAAARGYRVGGKTGTAEKQEAGGYREKALISSFVGAFPMDDPRYVVLAVLDEPKGTEASNNYATGGWVAAPAVGRIIERMAPLLGIAPQYEDPKALPGNSKMASFKDNFERLRERIIATY